ncbi:MAG: phosphodiester glycosidase family protein [Armatimonadetes bacterium]|nr:phosphodiester glycosidase family protein [Armatimonadota bacterium]
MKLIQRKSDYPQRVRLFLLALFLISLTIESFSAVNRSIAYEKRWVASIPAHVVTVNLNDTSVRLSPVLPRYGIGRAESWSSMVGRARPTAAITGTYFDTRSLHPVGDILVDGTLACRGVVGTAMCIDSDNRVRFIPTKRGRISDWSEYQHVLVGGPVIVWEGKVSVYPKAQGFNDPSLFARKARTAVGITRHNKLLMVAVSRPVYLSKLAKAMKQLGAVDAIALDGGGSTALYYRGRTFLKPSRRLTNLLVVYDSTSGYEQVRHLLAPASNRLATRRE